MFKSINYIKIIQISFLNGLISLVSYFGAFAHSDGGTGFIVNLLYVSFWILSMPFYIILLLLNIENPPILLAGLILNCIFYGFLIERLLWKFKRSYFEKLVKILEACTTIILLFLKKKWADLNNSRFSK